MKKKKKLSPLDRIEKQLRISNSYKRAAWLFFFSFIIIIIIGYLKNSGVIH